MAKKDPTDLTVEEKLETLYKLQTTLSAIDEKRALRGELPLEVQDLEDEIAGLTTRVEKIKDEIEDFQQAVTQKKAEIAAAQISVKKYSEQLDDVQNNREYDTLKKEIEFQTLEIELCNQRDQDTCGQNAAERCNQRARDARDFGSHKRRRVDGNGAGRHLCDRDEVCKLRQVEPAVHRDDLRLNERHRCVASSEAERSDLQKA